MTNALQLRRRGLLDADFDSIEADVPGVREYERLVNAGFEIMPVSEPLTPVAVDLNEMLTSIPLTVYTTGRRTNLPTLVSDSSVALGREVMPTLVTNIEPANSNGA